jgi:hypothetical protein
MTEVKLHPFRARRNGAYEHGAYGHGACGSKHAGAITPFVIRWGSAASSDDLRQCTRCAGAAAMVPRGHIRGGPIVCPITSGKRPWPFNVSLPSGLKTVGVVLVDQIRAIERADRMFAVIERVPAELLSEVRGRLAALLEFDVVSILADRR